MRVLGPELVTNGDFSSNTDWTLGTFWSISGGKLIHDSLNANELGSATQNIAISNGFKYYVTWEDSTFINPTYDVYLGDTFAGPTVDGQTNEYEVTAGAGIDIRFTHDGSSNPNANIIDNVSVRLIQTATNIEEALFSLFTFDDTLNDALIGLLGSRVYPEVVPQDTALPAVYYTQIAGPRQHTLGSSDNMVPSRWQFTVVGRTYAELREISNAIRLRFDSFSGIVGDVVIQCSHMIDENDLTDIRPGTDKLRRYTKAIDFNIWYNE